MGLGSSQLTQEAGFTCGLIWDVVGFDSHAVGGDAHAVQDHV